jgi:hypothetical protein
MPGGDRGLIIPRSTSGIALNRNLRLDGKTSALGQGKGQLFTHSQTNAAGAPWRKASALSLFS